MRPTIDQTIAITPSPNSTFNPKEKTSIDAIDRTICDTQLKNNSIFNQKKKSEKNKFINKLKELTVEGPITLRQRDQSNSLGQIPTCNRRERNKIAARESRDRKRTYIKMMEQRISQLQEGVSEANRQIERMRMQIFQVQMHQQGKKGELTDKQMHIIKKLQYLLQDEFMQERNNEINICLDSIVYRIGATGNQRKNALNKLYRDLINFSMPALYRYLLWTAQNKTHLFNGTGQEEILRPEDSWLKEIEGAVKDSIGGKASILSKNGELLASQKRALEESAEQLLEVKSIIQRHGPFFDKIINEIRESLHPAQVAELILFIERNQYKKQIRLFDQDENGMPCKKIKLNEVKIEQ